MLSFTVVEFITDFSTANHLPQINRQTDGVNKVMQFRSFISLIRASRLKSRLGTYNTDLSVIFLDIIVVSIPTTSSFSLVATRIVLPFDNGWNSVKTLWSLVLWSVAPQSTTQGFILLMRTYFVVQQQLFVSLCRLDIAKSSKRASTSSFVNISWVSLVAMSPRELDFQSVGLPWIFQKISLVCPGRLQWSHHGHPVFFLEGLEPVVVLVLGGNRVIRAGPLVIVTSRFSQEIFSFLFIQIISLTHIILHI